MAVLGLRFCARAFSSCGKRVPFFIAVRGPLTINQCGSGIPCWDHLDPTPRDSSLIGLGWISTGLGLPRCI